MQRECATGEETLARGFAEGFVVIFTCPRCGQQFETQVFARQYCSNRCRKAMENQRKMARDGARRDEATERRPDALVVRHAPTRELLEKVAQVYVVGGDSRPSVFTGPMPKWTKPAGVLWLRDATGAWIMQQDVGELTMERLEAIVEFIPPKPKTAVELLHEMLGAPVVVPEPQATEEFYITHGTPNTDFTGKYDGIPTEQPGLSEDGPIRRVAQVKEERAELTQEQRDYVARVEAEEKELLADL